MIFLTTEKLPFPNQFRNDYEFAQHLICPKCEELRRPISVPKLKIEGYQVNSPEYPFIVSMYYACPASCGLLVKAKLMMENNLFSTNKWKTVEKLPLQSNALPKYLLAEVKKSSDDVAATLSPYHKPYGGLLDKLSYDEGKLVFDMNSIAGNLFRLANFYGHSIGDWTITAELRELLFFSTTQHFKYIERSIDENTFRINILFIKPHLGVDNKLRTILYKINIQASCNLITNISYSGHNISLSFEINKRQYYDFIKNNSIPAMEIYLMPKDISAIEQVPDYLNPSEQQNNNLLPSYSLFRPLEQVPLYTINYSNSDSPPPYSSPEIQHPREITSTLDPRQTQNRLEARFSARF